MIRRRLTTRQREELYLREAEIDGWDMSYLFAKHRYARDGLPTRGASGERAVAKRIRDYVDNHNARSP